ncbi:MAG: hypothetical protein HJHJAOHD_02159 [Flavobacteriales bacterium]|nr:hypothetical protein [Flavobacteriales bacterium]
MVTDLKWTTVTSQEVEQAKFRLEASVFNVEAKKAKEDLKRCKFPVVPLCGNNGIATAYHRLRFRRVFVDKSDLPIFQPSQITDTNPKPELFISQHTKTNIDALRVKRNQILMTCSGTIGKLTLVSETLENKIFSHDLLRIAAINPDDTGLIYAYIKTKTGQLVLTTNNYGAVIQHIEPEHLDNFQIPYPSEKIRKSINEKILKSFELRDKSNKLLIESEQLLIGTLKLPVIEKLKPEFFNSDFAVQNYSVPVNQLDERFDGSYHLPIVNSIIDYLLDNAEKILPLGSKELTNEVFLPGRFKRVYVDADNGKVFFGGKQIYEIDPSNKKYLSLTQHGSRIAKELLLHENMLLVTRSGTVGRVNIVPKHFENWIANDHIQRVTPKDKDIAGYLYVWLNSDYGRILIERFIYGAVVDEIDDNHLSRVPVPIIKDKAVLKKINDLALEANKLRSEAYYLEQAAIEEVNEKVIFA